MKKIIFILAAITTAALTINSAQSVPIYGQLKGAKLENSSVALTPSNGRVWWSTLLGKGVICSSSACNEIVTSTANMITANLTGNVTGNVSGSAASFTGNLSGDVSGSQTATSVDKIKSIPVDVTGHTSGQALVFNGTNDGLIAGTVLTVPGGSNTQVQFNDSSAFGGDSKFSFNKTSGVLDLRGDMARSTVIGQLAGNGTHTTAADNTFVGYQSGKSITTGPRNTFIGSNTGVDSNGTDNTFIGYGAGQIATGSYNTVVGNGSYAAATGGEQNTVVGKNAGQTTAGNNNTYLGAQAGATSHAATGLTCLGYGACNSATSVTYSLLAGFNSGSNVTTGKYNTLLGAGTGSSLATGGHNVFVGYNAGTTGAATGYSVAIGDEAKANASNAVAIGDGAVASTANDIVLGKNTHNVKVPGTLDVTGTLTTNGLPINLSGHTAGQALVLNSSNDAIIAGDVTASGGGGGINYVTNGTAENGNTTGWALYSDSASTPIDGSGGSPIATFATSNTSPLLGARSFIYTPTTTIISGTVQSANLCITAPSSLTGIYVGQLISGTNIAAWTAVAAIPGSCGAGNIEMNEAATGDSTDNIIFRSVGDGVAYSFTIDSALKSSAMLAEFYYSVSGAYSSDVGTWIIPTNGTNTTPISCGTLSGTSGQVKCNFVSTSDATTYRLAIHQKTTSTGYVLKLDNVQVGPATNLVNVDQNPQYDITVTGTNWITNKAVGVPYMTSDGKWRLRFNIVGATTSGSRTNYTVNLTGVVFKNVSGLYQAVSLNIGAMPANAFAYVYPNSGDVRADHATMSTTSYYFSGDVELESKPTWATGTSSQTAMTVNTVGGSWSGYQANDCNWSTTSGSETDFAADTSCSLASRTSQNISVTPISSGSSGASLLWTPTSTGKFKVCATIGVAANSTYNDYLFLTDGSNGRLNNAALYGVGLKVVTLCGIQTVSTPTQQTTKIRGLTSGGTLLLGGAGSNTSIEWIIENISQGGPFPILPYQVSTPNTGGDTVARATVTGSSCAVTKGSGFLTPGADNGSGDCTMTFLTPFSDTPQCQCTPISGGASICPLVSVSATAVRFATYTSNTAAPDDTRTASLVCWGPR